MAKTLMQKLAKPTTDWQIEQLEAQLKKVYEERDAITDRIEKLKSDKEMPILKRKYEGRYFKYNNGYNATDRWWVYCHVRSVKARGHFIVSSFETTCDGKNEFQTRVEYSTAVMQVPITRRQYYAALKKFKSKLNQL